MAEALSPFASNFGQLLLNPMSHINISIFSVFHDKKKNKNKKLGSTDLTSLVFIFPLWKLGFYCFVLFLMY